MKAPFSVWAASLCDTVSSQGISPNSWQGKTPKVFGILWGFSNVSCSVDIVGKNFWRETRVSSACPSCLLSWCCLLSFLAQGHAGSCCEISLYLTTPLLLLSATEHHSLALEASVHRAPLPAQPRPQQHLCYHSLFLHQFPLVGQGANGQQLASASSCFSSLPSFSLDTPDLDGRGTSE